MRRNIVAGVCLAATAGLIVVLSATLDLDLESAALLGGALGAVVALVPDRSIAVRLAGFTIGFVISWAGYAIRASLLPDTGAGRAVAVVAVVLVCVAVTAATRDRLPLWCLLLGTAAFAGAYEFTYDQAPQELLSTSVSTATTLLFNVAAGLLAASVFAPLGGTATGRVGRGSQEPGPQQPPLADEPSAGRPGTDELAGAVR